MNSGDYMSWLRRSRAPAKTAPAAPPPAPSPPPVPIRLGVPIDPTTTARAIVILATPLPTSFGVAGGTVCTIVARFLGVVPSCTLSRVSLHCRQLSSHDSIWKGPACERWSELKLATKVEADPFPAWKSCYARKAGVKETGLNEIMEELGHCDWYTCPNGHLYVIGECRLPMSMGRCPQCGVRIGGEHHSMLRDNRRLGAVANSTLREKKIAFDEIQTSLSGRSNTWSDKWSWEQHKKARAEMGYHAPEECTVCNTRAVDVILMPCRHAIVCDDCLIKIRDRSNKCPSCSARIESVLRPTPHPPPTVTAGGAGAGSP